MENDKYSKGRLYSETCSLVMVISFGKPEKTAKSRRSSSIRFSSTNLSYAFSYNLYLCALRRAVLVFLLTLTLYSIIITII
jgi:hypothetical protein